MIYLELFWTFLKIGAFTFGGGYAMLALIQSEVSAKGWISEGELVDFIAVSESTPGPFAVNMATYVGSEMGGLLGAFVATLGIILPSFVIILIVAKCYEMYKKSKIVKGCMSGLKPAALGLIAAAVVTTGKTVFFFEGFTKEVFYDIQLYASAGIFLLALDLAFRKAHPIMIIGVSALCGILWGYLS